MGRYSNFYLPPPAVLLTNLRLMRITPEICYKQTKLPLQESSIPKLSYFIIYHSLEILSEDYKHLDNWYPPRTLSDQVQFKKLAVDLITMLQNSGKLPRNFIIDKRAFDDGERLVDILRYLSEFALRQQYIDRHSDLIQIGLVPENEDINKYYPQVITESKLIDEDVLELFETHIQLLKAQLVQKSTYEPFTLPFNFEELMNCIEYQNQIKDKLSKVPKELFSENRQLDRIQTMDKVSQMWRTLDLGIEGVDVGSNQFVQGQKEFIQVDVEWEAWLRKLVAGLKGLGKKRQEEQIKNPKRVQNMKKMLGQLKEEVQQLKQFREDVMSIMMD